MNEEELRQQKDVEFFAAGVNAWYNTSLEHDKSIFALSAGGIGLLITLLTTVGLSSSLLLHLYIAAILCFLASLVAILVVFRGNKKHIEHVLTSSANEVAPGNTLKVLDLVALVAFGLGATLTALIGISAAANSYESKGKTVATENKAQGSAPTPLAESFNGVKNLQPLTGVTKSFEGIQNLNPQAIPSVAAPTPAPAPPAQQPASSPALGTGKQGQ